MVHIMSLFMLMMLIYEVKRYTQYALLVYCKENRLEVNVENAANIFVFHEQNT